MTDTEYHKKYYLENLKGTDYYKQYYQENKDKIIERQTEYNNTKRKYKGRLASKRERVNAALKKEAKKSEEFRKLLNENSNT